MSKSKKLMVFNFEMDKVTFTFDKDDPYVLKYEGYGNYEGSRCVGKINKVELEGFIAYLENVKYMMSNKIKYNNKEFTKEEILELYELLSKQEGQELEDSLSR